MACLFSNSGLVNRPTGALELFFFLKAVSNKVRITPAHAGNTPLCTGWDVMVRDHPRACGEYSFLIGDVIRDGGSPPRMRGILLRPCRGRRKARITPAHAGNTPRIQGQNASHRDHPRACGEYCVNLNQVGNVLGSPPRMRGIQNGRKVWCKSAGITPAHAGNTPPVLSVLPS